jgi:hypothetical protein
VIPDLTTLQSIGFEPGVYTGLYGIAVLPSTAAYAGEVDRSAFSQGTATFTFDSTGATLMTCGKGCFAGIGTAKNMDVGGVSGVIEWGRWSNGSITAGGTANGATYGPNQGLAYIIGNPTIQLPITGTYVFNLIGGTSPLPSDGAGGGLGVGHLISGAANVNFGASTVSGNLRMGFNQASTYNLTFNGSIANNVTNGVTATTAYQSGGINVCGSTGCTTTMNGQFYGTNATYAGIGYLINTNGVFTINGTAAYKR